MAIQRLVSVFVQSRLDYCNAVLAGLPSSSLAPLQLVLYAAVHLFTGLGPRDHITGTMWNYTGCQLSIESSLNYA